MFFAGWKGGESRGRGRGGFRGGFRGGSRDGWCWKRLILAVQETCIKLHGVI